jgi:hypothetical protein
MMREPRNTSLPVIDEKISCPKCGAEIPLSEALTARIEERLRRSFQDQALEAEKKLNEQHQRALREIEAKAFEKACEGVTLQLADLKAQLQEKDQKLQQTQKQELTLLRKQRELEDERRNLELEVERKLQEQKAQVEKAAIDRLAEQHRLKEQEKDKQLNDLREQIEAWKRKAEQGSQQLQGEVAQLDLERALEDAFPDDEFTPVPKGIRGVDLIQRVSDASGKTCGTIAWEVKNTRNWSNAWLSKLRDDQRSLKADIAVIVTTILPDDVQNFRFVDGVWVTDRATALGLASAIRIQLLQVASARASAKGKGSRMDLLYSYLTGTEFRQRVEAVVEGFRGLREELDRERRAMEANWASREKQIARALSGVAGMYGDIQGIVGPSLPRVRHLELAAPQEGGVDREGGD